MKFHFIIVARTGCRDSDQAEIIPDPGEQKESGFDIIKATTHAAELPTFLEHSHETILGIDASTVNHQELLEHIPCYCGCTESADHKQTLDCFIYETTGEDVIVWNSHGMKCGVCLNIAGESMQIKVNGKNVADIRHVIDEKYSKEYPASTPTPQP